MIHDVPQSTVPGDDNVTIPEIKAWQIERLARVLCVCDGYHPDEPLRGPHEAVWAPPHLENYATVNEAMQDPVRWHNYTRHAYRALVTDALMYQCKPSLVE